VKVSIATQLNSTELNWTELISTELNSTSSWFELRRYKRAFTEAWSDVTARSLWKLSLQLKVGQRRPQSGLTPVDIWDVLPSLNSVADVRSACIRNYGSSRHTVAGKSSLSWASFTPNCSAQLQRASQCMRYTVRRVRPSVAELTLLRTGEKCTEHCGRLLTKKIATICKGTPFLVCQPSLEHQIRLCAPSSVISRPTCFSSSLRCCWLVAQHRSSGAVVTV